MNIHVMYHFDLLRGWMIGTTAIVSKVYMNVSFIHALIL